MSAFKRQKKKKDFTNQHTTNKNDNIRLYYTFINNDYFQLQYKSIPLYINLIQLIKLNRRLKISSWFRYDTYKSVRINSLERKNISNIEHKYLA